MNNVSRSSLIFGRSNHKPLIPASYFLMSRFSSPTAISHKPRNAGMQAARRARSKEQRGTRRQGNKETRGYFPCSPVASSPHLSSSCVSNPARGIEKAARHNLSLLGKGIVFLIGMQILLSTFYLQEAQTQDVTAHEISDLEQQLRVIEEEIVSINAERESLIERFNTVTNEIDKLKQELREEKAKPKGFLSKITSIFSRKRGRLEDLLTEAQDLADTISDRQKKLVPLVNQFVELADKLIDKSTARMITLMDVVREADLSNEITVRNEAWKQVSSLWQLAERTTAARNKYAPNTFGPERTITFPSLLSSDPEELRVGAAILKGWAAEERNKANLLERQIEKLQSRKSLLERMMELSKEIQRSDEERGSEDVTPNIPWGSDVAIKTEISDIEEQIRELSAKKQEYRDNAERFDGQSKDLEQMASQIDVEIKGKPNDD